nr:hypothetical protein [Paenibacillus anaericanus]
MLKILPAENRLSTRVTVTLVVPACLANSSWITGIVITIPSVFDMPNWLSNRRRYLRTRVFAL